MQSYRMRSETQDQMITNYAIKKNEQRKVYLILIFSICLLRFIFASHFIVLLYLIQNRNGNDTQGKIEMEMIMKFIRKTFKNLILAHSVNIIEPTKKLIIYLIEELHTQRNNNKFAFKSLITLQKSVH